MSTCEGLVLWSVLILGVQEQSSETQLSSVSVPTRVFRPAGRHMYRIIAGNIGDIAIIKDLSGSVQISTCQGLDLPDKQAEISNPRVWRKNRGVPI